MMLVTIAQAADISGLSAKMIRHYEQIGLIRKPVRGENQYRHYSQTDLHELCFIRRARELGFSLEDIRQLLSLWRDRQRSSADIKAIAIHHIEEMERKAASLMAMSQTLKLLAERCNGDDRPDCPILVALGAPKSDDSCCDP